MTATSSAVWGVQVIGCPSDLEHLSRNFSTPDVSIVKDEQDNCCLLSSRSFANCTTSEAVLREAERILNILSGTLRFVRESDEPLRSGAVILRHPGGRRDIFVSIREQLSLRAEVSEASLTVTNSDGVVIDRSPPPRTTKITALALIDSAIAKALRLLAVDGETWGGIYRLIEVIEHDVGGESKLIHLGWGGAGQLKRFKHTANSSKAAGDKARHASEVKDPPKDPMKLEEAVVFLKLVLSDWFTSKGA